ncbi:transglutaminase domain-containing protein [Polaribacter sp. PL03]|uniref:transglutaminase domain-containing protein n=1 Tax=Polaribacter sp. PL03 TaxID=3088353 RepID=UPI0029CEA77D|nr:transglutaminase domain-containing protein [Polaribacter sp. PL03]MDX6748077.1 transglutaminase domain-containing protein [Polaribacter sp. PL03]
MKIKLNILLFLISFNGFSQKNFEKIDENARNMDYSPNKELAKELTKGLTSDIDKVRSIFIWITDNIEYDFELLNNQELQDKVFTSNNTIIEHTLKTKKAICSGYSILFKNLCDKVGVESVSIEGISRQFLDRVKRKNEPDHAWNAVKIDNKWFLLDVTWASGNGLGNNFEKDFNDYWFLTNPKEFFHSHFPTEQKWSLLNKKLNINEFYDLPLIVSNHLFTQGISLITPKNGIIEISNDNKFKFIFTSENIESEISLIGFPGETYASLNNLPAPSDEEYFENIDKYSLMIPSIKLINKTVENKKTTLEYRVIHKSLKNISLSINEKQTAEYKVKWK